MRTQPSKSDLVLEDGEEWLSSRIPAEPWAGGVRPGLRFVQETLHERIGVEVVLGELLNSNHREHPAHLARCRQLRITMIIDARDPQSRC